MKNSSLFFSELINNAITEANSIIDDEPEISLDNFVMESAKFKKKEKYKLQDSYEFMGLPIAIENKAGTYREGIDPDGHKWKQKMNLDYGYIKKTKGEDGEGIDVYIGEEPSDKVYIVKQHKIEAVKKWDSEYCPDCGEHIHDCGCPEYYDEDKVFLGFGSKQAVKEAYIKQYDSPLFLGPISVMKLSGFHDLFENTNSPDLPWQLVAESAAEWKGIVLASKNMSDLRNAIQEILYASAKIYTPTDAEAVKNPKKESLRTLESLEKVGGSVVANALAKSWRGDKPGSLVGQKAKTAKDFAILSQIYRNPSFETFRIFFMNAQNEIVHQTGVSSRMPGSSGTIPSDQDPATFMGNLLEAGQKAGGKKVALLHNHPSGNVEPSEADISVTQQLAKRFESVGIGFFGHIIVNHGVYSVILANGKTVEGALPNAVADQTYGTEEPTIQHPLLWKKISSVEDVVEIGLAVRKPNFFTVIGRRANGIVSGLGDMPIEATKDIESFGEALRSFSLATGSATLVAANMPKIDAHFIGGLNRRYNYFLDIVTDEGESLRGSRGDYFEVSDDIAMGSRVIAEPVLESTDQENLIFESAPGWKDQIKSAVSIDSLKEAARNALYMIADKKENKSIIPDYSYDTHKEVAGLIRRGELNADQLRRLYKQFQEQIPAIQEKLKSKTIKELAPKGAGGYKKPEIIEKIIGQMRGIFVLGDVFSYSPFSESIEQAMDRLLGSYTDEDIQKTAQERRERIARIKKAYENPETLSEFRDFISRKGFEALSPEQKEKYDELIAGQTKQFSEQQKTQKKDVQTASVTTTAELIETTHTRDNYPLFVIQLQERLEKEDYYKLLSSAKKMGGWYSSFSKNGAIPGFQFKDKESAQAFQKLVETGDKQSVQSLVVDNKQQDDIEKQKNAANRLKQSADKIISKAQEKLSADRLSNTARRAAQAASMEKTANQSIQLACSMKNIANALEKGQAKHLSGISNTKQVEQINNALKRAAYNERLKKYSTYSERLSHEDEAVTSASVEFAESMFPKIYTDNMGEVFEKLDGKRGYANLVKKYKSIFHGKEFYQPSNKSEMDELADMILSADLGSYSMLTMSVERYKRWIGMGIENDSMLRAALREYVQYNAEQPEEDKVKALERAVVGRKVGIDFFPTPKHVATDIVDMADIKPGMRVLEPSAGNGNIAEVIREAGVEPDTIEISTELGEILKAKGFNIVGSDFLESDQKYDRIVMNPPFGNGMDIDHVKHAYDLLLPGGKLVAIMGEGSFFRGDKKATEFRNWLDSVGGTSEKLDENTFTDKSLLATTGANARVVIIEKENQITETALKDSLVFESASDWKEQIRNAHSIDEMVQVARDLLVIENASRSRREYVDTGEKIGGAKKDVWAAILAGQKALDAGDLEGMDSGTANKLVNKKNVTRDTLQSCIDKGADPGAVFLMSKILGSYDAKPGDTDLARESYVKGHALVQEYFQAATSIKDIENVVSQIKEELKGYNLTPHEKQKKDAFDAKEKSWHKLRDEKWTEFLAQFQKGPFASKNAIDKAFKASTEWQRQNKEKHLPQDEITAYSKLVKSWHEREDKNPESRRNLYKALGEKFINVIKGQSQSFIDNVIKAKDINDFSFLNTTKEVPLRKKTNKPQWVRNVPENVELTRNLAIVFKPEDLTSKFGIRGVEYGNWVDEESAKHHTQMLGLSLLDLSDILGISPEKVSYGGRLGIRFGSNGTGKFAAHYEPSHKAINLTKLKGGGSFAHEWAHFLDNVVHMVSHDGDVKHSYGSDSVSGANKVQGNKTQPFGDKLPKDVENAFAEIHKLMTEGNEGRNESKSDDPGFTSYNANLISSQISKLGPQGAMDYFANQTRGRWSKAKRETVRTPIYNTEMLQKIADFIHFKTGEKVLFGEGKSKFMHTSSSWGGEYWTRPHELFARAFEAVVNKKMKDRGARNTYLVYGVDPVDGAPYPDNDELKKLEPAFDKLIALLKENKILEKALAYA